MTAYIRGNEEFVKRIGDLVDRSFRQQMLLITPFLSPLQLEIAKNVIGKQMYTYIGGGYEDAESCRIGMCPYETDTDLDIVCLKSTYKAGDRILTHRDVLGAFMNVGMQRNQFGDILVQDENIYVFVNAHQVDFLMLELKKIANYAIDFEVYKEPIKTMQELIWKVSSVSSMRLDCIVAVCANISRTKAESLIRGKLVKVNHMPLEECKCLCNNNSTVSIRGFGRFMIRSQGRISKKGKNMIEIGTYM